MADKELGGDLHSRPTSDLERERLTHTKANRQSSAGSNKDSNTNYDPLPQQQQHQQQQTNSHNKTRDESWDALGQSPQCDQWLVELWLVDISVASHCDVGPEHWYSR